MLNSLQIKECLIFPNGIQDKQLQQVSIDLRIKKIQVLNSVGEILSDKTILPEYEELKSREVLLRDGNKKNGWLLAPGYYNFIFEEGIQVPANVAFLILQRSSLLRSGTTLTSSLWDPNFKVSAEEGMSSFATVNQRIFIEKGARVASIYGWETDEEIPVDLLYNGQYQAK